MTLQGESWPVIMMKGIHTKYSNFYIIVIHFTHTHTYTKTTPKWKAKYSYNIQQFSDKKAVLNTVTFKSHSKSKVNTAV